MSKFQAMLKALDVEAWISGRRAGIEEVQDAVGEIIAKVRRDGDEALFELTEQFDGISLEALRVSEEERKAAYGEVSAEHTRYLIEAEARITQFHELQKRNDLWLQEVEPGITLGVKTTALERIGTYIPGGRAAYSSTALMTAVPARVAGVKEICCCSPPSIHPLTLIALDIAGVEEIYRVGGAHAIAAMALGTPTVKPVQKIVGPGNVYVTAAKMLLRDHTEIDFPAGPSEIGILGDSTANPAFIAADILAQSEHDPHAASVLITTEAGLADAVNSEIARQFAEAPRREIIKEALGHSGIIIAESLEEAIETMDRIAPEHLSIQVSDPLGVLNRVRNAGSIFVGPFAPVACGDYASGTNHVLPTAGYARLYSGLDVNHFCKTSTVQIIDRTGLAGIGDVAESLADAEGLHAHAESIRIRRNWKKE